MTDKERVLRLLEDGKITSEEAIKMLELLGVEEKGSKADESEQEFSESESFRQTEEGEKKNPDGKFGIYVDVNSMDIIVRSVDECEKVEYRFVDMDTEELMEVPEHVDVYYSSDKLKISENFLKNFGPKMASGSFGKKVIDMFGLSANEKFNGILEVFIPRNQVIGEAKFSTKSGDVKMDRINTIEKMSLSSLSGDLIVRDVICDRMHLNAVSGDVLINGIVANIVKCSCVSGDFKMLGKIPEVDVNCVSGDIKIVNDILLYNSKLNSVSGSIKVYVSDEENQNYTVTGMLKPKNLKGRADGESGTGLKMNTMSGSVKLFDRSKYEGQWFKE